MYSIGIRSIHLEMKVKLWEHDQPLFITASTSKSSKTKKAVDSFLAVDNASTDSPAIIAPSTTDPSIATGSQTSSEIPLAPVPTEEIYLANVDENIHSIVTDIQTDEPSMNQLMNILENKLRQSVEIPEEQPHNLQIEEYLPTDFLNESAPFSLH